MKRRLASASVVLVAALGLGACGTMSPVQTDELYAAADGIPVDLGTIQVRGLVIVSEGMDSPGALSGQIVNRTTKATTVTFRAQGLEPLTVEAQPGSTTLGGEKAVSLSKIAGIPGSVLQLKVDTEAGGSADAFVPVLAPKGYYSTITPAPTFSVNLPTTPQQ